MINNMGKRTTNNPAKTKGGLLFAFLLFCLPLSAQIVPGYNTAQVDKLAQAIAKAEGYGPPKAKPTRLNNPGDIRAPRGVHYPGQLRIERQGYVVFKTPAAGRVALQEQIVKIIRGESNHYTLNTTINQMARRYATNWRPWAKNVSKQLGVPGSTTLGEILTSGYLDVPPQVPYN